MLLRVSNLVAPLGLNSGVIHCATRYATSDHRRLGTVFRESLGFAMLFGGLIALAMCIAAPALAHRVFNKHGLVALICLFAVGIPLAAGLSVASAATRVSQSMKYSVYAESLTQPATNLALIIGFYLIGWRLLGAAAAVVISFAVGLTVALHYEWRLFPHARFWGSTGSDPVAGELLQFSLIAWLGTIFINLVPWVDRLFVGVYLMPAEVGIYQAAAQASVLLSVIGGAFDMAVAPRISSLCQSSQTRRLGQLYRLATKWVLYASIPFALVFCFAPREVLVLMYGPRYAGGARLLIIFTIMRLIDALAGPVGVLLIFTARQRLFSVVSGGSLMVCATLNYLLIPRFGAVGAAWATASANTGMMLALIIGVRATIGTWPWEWRWVKGIVASAAVACTLSLMAHLDLKPPLVGLLFPLALSIVVFYCTLLLLGLDPEDREVIQTLRSYLVTFGGAANGDRVRRSNPS